MNATLLAGNQRRIRYAQDHGLDLLYAELGNGRFDTWCYSDGQRCPMRSFATLEGLQRYAARFQYAIIYVS